MPRLCKKMRTPGTTMWAPKPAAFDWISETPVRSSSTTHSAMVSPLANRPPSEAFCRGLIRSRRGDNRSGSIKAAPSAPSWRTSRRSKAAWRDDSINKWAHWGSSGERGTSSPAAIHAAARVR